MSHFQLLLAYMLFFLTSKLLACSGALKFVKKARGEIWVFTTCLCVKARTKEISEDQRRRVVDDLHGELEKLHKTV